MKTAYLDIETSYGGQFTDQRLFRDYKHHRITVLGLRVRDGDSDSFLQFIAEDVSKEALLAPLHGASLIVTYNGRSIPDEIKGSAGFDFPVIAAQLGVVLDKEFNHLDLCPACWRRGLWGGQKKVEQMLGLKRKLPGRDGAWADAAWKKYEATGEKALLQELLEYNREDVWMLARIQDALDSRRFPAGDARWRTGRRG